MGLKTQDELPSRKRVFLKLGQDKDVQHKPFVFQLYNKNESSGKWEVTNKFIHLEGLLVDVKVEEGEYEGQPISTLKFDFMDNEDPNTIMTVSTSFNNLSRGIINTLANQDKYGLLTLKTYLKKAKEGDKQYPSIYVTNDGEQMGWKTSFTDLPQIVKQKVGKKDVFDSTELDEELTSYIEKYIKPAIENSFYYEEYKNSTPSSSSSEELTTEEKQSVASATGISSKATTSSSKPADFELDVDSDDDDDLPF